MSLKNDIQNKQYILTVNKKQAWIDYKTKENKIYLLHTEVPKELRGQGIGKKLVTQTLQAIHKEQLHVVPVCSYAKAIISRNKELNDLLTPIS